MYLMDQSYKTRNTAKNRLIFNMFKLKNHFCLYLLYLTLLYSVNRILVFFFILYSAAAYSQFPIERLSTPIH